MTTSACLAPLPAGISDHDLLFSNQASDPALSEEQARQLLLQGQGTDRAPVQRSAGVCER